MVWSQTKPNEEGITRRLTAPRRLIVDLLHFAKRVPSIPVERTMHLGPLFVERQGLANRPGWNTVFLKAFALAAVEFPELRTSYLPCPYNRLFEHPCSVASLAIERMEEGDPAILFMKIWCPEGMALWQIEEKVLEAKTRPIEAFSPFSFGSWHKSVSAGDSTTRLVVDFGMVRKMARSKIWHLRP